MSDTNSAVSWTPPRGRWTEEDGTAMVAALRAGGESPGAFARRHTLDPQRVGYWVGRIEQARAPRRRKHRAPAAITFAPVRVVDKAAAEVTMSPTPTLDVRIGAAVVRVGSDFDEALLRRVVTALGGAAC